MAVIPYEGKPCTACGTHEAARGKTTHALRPLKRSNPLLNVAVAAVKRRGDIAAVAPSLSGGANGAYSMRATYDMPVGGDHR